MLLEDQHWGEKDVEELFERHLQFFYSEYGPFQLTDQLTDFLRRPLHFHFGTYLLG